MNAVSISTSKFCTAHVIDRLLQSIALDCLELQCAENRDNPSPFFTFFFNLGGEARPGSVSMVVKIVC